jgi:hypothetical protein
MFFKSRDSARVGLELRHFPVERAGRAQRQNVKRLKEKSLRILLLGSDR